MLDGFRRKGGAAGVVKCGGWMRMAMQGSEDAVDTTDTWDAKRDE